MNDDESLVLSSVFLVRSEHLNHFGHLFGGALMAEIDTIGFCLLRRLFPGNLFVTRAAEIGFERPAYCGDAVVFEARLLSKGTTSAQVDVAVTVDGTAIGRGRMVYVNIDSEGRKTAL